MSLRKNDATGHVITAVEMVREFITTITTSVITTRMSLKKDYGRTKMDKVNSDGKVNM